MSQTLLDKFIKNKGRQFYPLLCPSDIKRGKTGDCFDHCLMEAVKSRGKYRYCEGIVLIKGQWIHHAWLTDSGGLQAYDPTWKALTKDNQEIPLGMATYVGAILDLRTVVDFVQATEYKSPFANADKNPGLAEKVYESAL